MSRDSYSRGRGGAALLLLIAAAALVVAVLAIFTSVFEKDKAKPDDAPGTDVIQPAEPDRQVYRRKAAGGHQARRQPAG